ncbi:hypothetical protein Ahy_A04g020309 isoform F [Arachis hypogaea]|uniref:B-like cyclin n=1 Tax=Arachis hypogaea TaxID=3818 RepID=A0A445DHJ7_ARAHY|nr:hypothetical protein Ahy_A04g020309 isoform F [Arachis hypogaea]
MAGLVSGELSHHGAPDGNSSKSSKDTQEETLGRWYMSRKEIEENSPSRKDGVDLKKETYLRKSYCTFLQDLGMRLKVPQVTIATAIIFCHRFFLRQSHAKNDRRTIATVCMFLAGKVEETPRPLKDVILVSYEIIHKKDPAAAQRIKQKVFYYCRCIDQFIPMHKILSHTAILFTVCTSPSMEYSSIFYLLQN